MLGFKMLTKQYIFTGTKLISSTDGFATTAEVTTPAVGTGNTVAIWQNRFWIASGYTLSYSAPQDFENYTNSATAGGTTNIPEISTIYKIMATKNGLYVFTDKGIFLQSGSSKAWSIEKISELLVPNKKSFTQADDGVYFIIGRTVYVASGYSIGVFCEIPSALDTAKTTIRRDEIIFNPSRSLLIISNNLMGEFSFVYDVKNKSWSRSLQYNFLCPYGYINVSGTGKYIWYFLPTNQQSDRIYNILTSTYQTPLTWYYATAWITLDGNPGNRKEIDRIEIDALGGTHSVFLFWASGNGLSSFTNLKYSAPINTRLSTYTWNSPMGKNQSNRFYFQEQSDGAQTMTTNYVLKQIRIYYRNIGNYKTNTLR